MTKITKLQKQIADRHLQARITGKFDPVDFQDTDGLIKGLVEGKVYEGVLREVELRYVSITSNLLVGVFGESTGAHKAGVYKGFKTLLNAYNVK